MLADLLNRTTAPDRILSHSWSEGDLVIWDDRGLLHRVHEYEPTSRRSMDRTTIVGDEPIR